MAVSKHIDPAYLVQFVTRLATERGTVLTPLRLVKLLYLADLYYARENFGETLTGWPWAFVHYGPYCGEAMQAIDASVGRKLIAALPYESSYDGEEKYVYRCDSEGADAVENQLPIYVTSPLKGAVRKWADDSPQLLDHVYFETEPMIDATPGQLLDFSLAQKLPIEKPLTMLKLTKEKMQAARERVKNLAGKYREQSARVESAIEHEPRDLQYQRSISALNGEPLMEGLNGEAALHPTQEDESH